MIRDSLVAALVVCVPLVLGGMEPAPEPVEGNWQDGGPFITQWGKIECPPCPDPPQNVWLYCGELVIEVWDQESKLEECGSWFWRSRAAAYAKVEAGMSTADGHGSAVDNGCVGEEDARVALGVEGSWTRQWIRCGRPGRVEHNASVTITGFANLIRSQCAGAALGYVEVESNVLGSLRRALDTSAAETEEGTIGDIPWLGGITIHQGTGPRRDTDAGTASKTECVDSFTTTHNTGAYVHVWANATLFNGWRAARVRADIHGSVTNNDFTLGDCPPPEGE